VSRGGEGEGGEAEEAMCEDEGWGGRKGRAVPFFLLVFFFGERGGGWGGVVSFVFLCGFFGCEKESGKKVRNLKN